MALYLFANGAAGTAAAPVAVTTGTAIKTLLQMKGVTAMPFKVVEWGISFDGNPTTNTSTTPIKCELVETGTIFATVTAAVAADIMCLDPNGPTSTTYFAVGTTSTGYTSSAEGSVVAARLFDVQFIAPTSQYVKQFPLGREPIVNAVSALRVRVTSGTAVNAYCYVIVEA